MTRKLPPKEDKLADQYRRVLLEKRESVLTGLGAKAHALVRGDRISDEDQAQHSLDEAVSLRLNGIEYVQLRQIQEALDRLQLGEYGICLTCQGLIAAKRLEALPWAKFCVKCQGIMADKPFDD